MTRAVKAKPPALLVCLWFLLAASPVPGGAEEPRIRIGLGDPGPQVSISATGGFVLATPGGRRIEVAGTRRVRVESSRTPAPGEAAIPSLFRILVASSPDEEAVRYLAGWLEERLVGRPVLVSWNEERRAWRAYLGAYPSREEAARDVPELLRRGLSTIWITERTHEEAERGTPAPMSVRLDGETQPVYQGAGVLRLEPEAGSRLRVNRRTYRGALEVRPASGGGLQVINELPMEAYLRGVVPLEMGPYQFPNPDALKAQAVAARTYAYRHLGQFRHLGYDLCDSQRCQVYGGSGAEYPATDQAVSATRGEVLTYSGQPIRAYFTASCGGHTEDVTEVFVEEEAPFVTGVPCPSEEPVGWILRSRHPQEVLAGPDGTPLNLPIAWLVVQDLAPRQALSRGWSWRRPAGKENWPAEARRHFSEYLREPVPEARSGSSRMTRPVSMLPSRAQVLFDVGNLWLRRVGEWWEGAVIAFTNGTLTVRTSTGTEKVETGDLDYLFVGEDLDQRPTAAHPRGVLLLSRGDRVRWTRDPAGRARILIAGMSRRRQDARLTPEEGSWSEEKTPEDLAARLRPRTGLGEPLWIRPLRWTPSGRVSEVAVGGGAGVLTLRGIRVRWGLGLPETLFRPADWPRPLPEDLRFQGRGRGHGVGMCQRGAFGLAERGWNHRRILTHYYTGVSLDTLW